VVAAVSVSALIVITFTYVASQVRDTFTIAPRDQLQAAG
jgi:hypothetical protein